MHVALGAMRFLTTLFLVVAAVFFAYNAGQLKKRGENMAGDIVSCFFLICAIFFMWN